MSLPNSFDLIRRRDVAAAAVRSATRVPSILLPHTRSGSVGMMPSRTVGESRTTIASVIESAFPGEAVLMAPDGGDRPTGWLIVGHITGDAFPNFGPSVAYLVDGEPLVSAIQVPTFDETFSAARGQGATLNERPLRVAPPRDIERTLVLSTHLEIAVPGIGEVVSRLAGWRMPTRQAGPLALLCYLATGRIDGFVTRVSGGPQLSAGELLVREAGGVSTTVHHDGTTARNPVLAAASNADLLEQMLRRLEMQDA